MNKAKTLKRRLGEPRSFLSVAWDTDDILSLVNINPNFQWRDVNWKRDLKNVFKLQKLIYRASSCGQIRKIPKYQRLLSKSYNAWLLAVRKVTQDKQGKKTVGVDGIKNLSPMGRFNLVSLLKTPYFKASPTFRVWRPKPGRDEKRELGMTNMYDRALQALVKLSRSPEWEPCFEPNSYGFRPGRSIHDAIEAIF